MDLSVIILSYNTKDITSRCLKHVLSAKDFCQKKLNNKIEIIVIDNASDDGSATMIKQDFPQVKLMASKVNTGFSKGNNIGMKQARNPYILLLNSDVYLQDDSLYKALAYFRVNLNCDVLGSRLNYASGKLQYSSGNLPNPINIFFWIFGLKILSYHTENKKFFSKAHKVGWVMGAFFMLKRKVFEETVGFDENLFMYMEEIEWCKRIRDLGFKIWYVPQVAVIHLHGASSNFDPKLSFLNELSGIKYYLLKHYHPFYLPVKIFLLAGLMLRSLIFFIFGKKDRAAIYRKGLSLV